MSEEEMEILKELSEQNYFGDLPFLLYADLIGKLIANYNKEKEKNKELDKFIKEGITIEPNNPYKNFQLNYLRENFIPKSKVKELLKEINTDYIPVFNIQNKIKILEKLQNEFKDNEEIRIKIIAYKELLDERNNTDER